MSPSARFGPDRQVGSLVWELLTFSKEVYELTGLDIPTTFLVYLEN
jgi:hypothetical protein